MNLKRVFAGVAAAATMLGGLTLGATTANAEAIEIASTSTITVNNAQTGHTYTPYLFATFNNAQTVGDTTYVDVNTVGSNEGATDAEKAMFDAVKSAADVADGDATIPQEYANNPAAYVATFNATQLRAFADALTGAITAEGSQIQAAVTGQGPTADNNTVKFTLPTGWYAVTDTKNSPATPGDSTASTATAIVATKSVPLTITLPHGNGQVGITTTGEYNAKSADAMAPTDVTKKVSDSDIHDGQQITYTVTAKIPAAAAGYEFYGFQFADKADQDLSIDMDTVHVSVGENTLTSEQYTATQNDAKTILTVKIPEAQNYAGQIVTLTYEASPIFGSVNAVTNSVQANAFLSLGAFDTGTTADASSAPAKATVKTHDVTFTKVGVDGDAAGLEDAQFAIKNADGEYGKYANNKWTWAAAEKAPLAATSAANGEVSFPNIAAGNYTVEEIQAPAGYAQNLLPAFQITVGTDDTVTLDKDGNTLGLASTGDNGGITVKNVKSITQLPLTGAAGITMLVVVALLLGGAGALIAVRSRSLKRQLNA
ncbi:cell surface protein fimafimbrial subunit [Bifidobacterium pseudolongum subsp. pseudolongum]|uniref:Cell surface protein fimafimbrial subunit n=1 Tax=Bifidobacterium pseudolongum subsp. pseudolongum TaxID=31954 RepID=A0A4Q5A8H6_9BIFI|nr:SpaH/EbpB family LPXTG-anchored major pilin [Bifidobacterium pseudolongum]RYQ19711.1 cell surface protein fimafimbrial subunit [Bifidobacterium pseudolongum subsp. pseudolongum]